MKHFLLLPLLLLPVAAAAATLRSAYVPPAGATVREVPLDTRKPRLEPLPAPAPTNHFASPPALPPAWKI